MNNILRLARQTGKTHTTMHRLKVVTKDTCPLCNPPKEKP